MSMQPFTRLSAKAAPLLIGNVDTDQIVRIDRLIEFPRDQLGPYCLESFRYLPGGALNPDFVPNRAKYQGLRILVTGENFGCGSSREHAVSALLGWGVRCVIGTTFGDIFYTNCCQNGLLPVRLPDADIAAIARELEGADPPVMTVDLVAQKVITPCGREVAFEIDTDRREALLEGLDEIGLTLRNARLIESFRERDQALRPWIYQREFQPSMKKLLILAGDGIGAEILPQTRRVAQWFIAHRGVKAQLHEELFGISAWEAHRNLMREETWQAVQASDAILFGAIGSPAYETIPADARKVDQLLRIRKELDLFINFRPVKALAVLHESSTLRPEVLEGTDMVLVRELSSGIYFGTPRGISELPDGRRRVVNTMVYTSDEIERIARAAFQLARTRTGKVCSVDKGNVLENGALWREVVQQTRDRDFPDVELSHMYVDNCAMQLVRAPRQFDVVLTENLFGDILSDCAAMVCGSIGMLPSVSMSEVRADGQRHALYEPIHGSAPDIAGRGIANPLGSILSFAMCLRYTLDAPQEAERLEAAVARVVGAGIRTADIAAPGAVAASTSEMGTAVLQELDRSLQG